MIIATLWFLSKMIDLFLTNIIIMQGGHEANPFLKPMVESTKVYGEYAILIWIFFTSLVLFFIDFFLGDNKIIKEVISFVIATSFIICFYNVALILI